jgi:energy-coupling factor transporter transmembrane protein EcfT
MHRAKSLFIIAILVMLIPNLGLTNLMEQITFFVLGFVILIFSYGIYFENKNKDKPQIKKTKTTPSILNKKTAIPETQVPFRSHKEFSEEMTGFSLIRREPKKTPDDNFNI